MGFFDFFKKAKQGNPNSAVYWPNDFFNNLWQRFANPTNADITVTSESAYQVAAYWAAVRAISEDIAKLPVKAYTLDKDGNRKPIANTPILKVLTQGFNEETDSMTGIQTMVQWMLTFGNAYAEIQRNSMGDIRLTLLHPARVTPHRDGDGVLYYEIHSEDEAQQRRQGRRPKPINANDMLHLKGPGNGVVGYSIGEIAAQSLGISIASQNFTGSFFGNNLSVGSALETDKPLDPDVKESIRKEWKRKFGGSKNAYELAILDRGFKYNQIQMNSTDAELLSTRKFQVQEIARWFRIPPHKIMDMTQAKFANLEQNDLNYITDTLTPWISRLEKQIKFKFHRTDNTYIDFDEKGLARGDMAARTAYYNSLLMNGAITPNQIRKAEGFEISDNTALDQYYMQMQMQPIDLNIESQELDNEAKKKALEEPEPQPMPEPEPEPQEPQEPPAEEPEEDTGQQQAAITAYLPTMIDNLTHLVNNEFNAHNFTTATKTVKAKCEADPQEFKNYLEKFYAKHEPKLHDMIQTHVNYLCLITGKEKPDLSELVKTVSNMDKSEGWQNSRAEEIAQAVIELVTGAESIIQFGQIVQGEDGENYILTKDGYRAIDVIPKV